MSEVQTKTTRSWGLVLFGSLFALPGLFLLVMMTGGALYDAVRMQSWVETDANILSSEVKHFSGDTSTYKIVADYTYQVNGRTYEGDRVSIHGGSDNVGDYHHETGRKLSRSSKETTVFYNPKQPDEAIIDRSLRWEMIGFSSIIGFIFALVGCGIIYFGARGSTEIISPETVDKPWLAKPEWANNKISSDAKTVMYVLIFFSLIWNLMVWPTLLFNGESIYNEVHPMILPILAIFPLVGLYLIFLSSKAVKQHISFGKTPLVLTPFPGSIGGQIGGKVEFSKHISSLESFPVKVVCLRKNLSSSKQGSNIKEHLVWEGNTFARHYSHATGSGLEFSLDVPDNLPETELDKDDHWHEWRVDIESPEIKLKRSFDIPVYRTAQQSTIRYKVPQQLIQQKKQVALNDSLPVKKVGVKYAFTIRCFINQPPK